MASSVAVLGVGSMGLPLVHRLVTAGFRVLAYDADVKALERLPDAVQRVSTPREAADSAGTVIGCLPSLQAYRQTVLGRQGVVHGSAVSLYLHVGTTGAKLARALSDALKKNGIDTLDAPMTGGPERVKNGTLSVMTSGSESARRRARAVLKSYASTLTPIGAEVGMAQAVNVHNNLLYVGNLLLASEALLAAQKAGVALPRMLDVLESGSGQSWVTSHMVPRHVVTGRFAFGANLGMLKKDLNAALQEFDRLAVDAPMARAVQRQLHRTLRALGESDDVTAVFRPLSQS